MKLSGKDAGLPGAQVWRACPGARVPSQHCREKTKAKQTKTLQRRWGLGRVALYGVNVNLGLAGVP